jgi:sugar phosphate permease
LKLASQWLPPKRFALVTGMTLMSGMIGAVAGQAPLAAAVAAFGWRGTLSAAAFFAFGIAVLIWLIVRDKPSSVQKEARTQTDGLLHGLKLTMKNPQSWYAAVYGGTMTAGILAFAGLWGVPYLMQVYGLERLAAAASTSLMLIGWGIGAPLAGWVSDHLGTRRVPMLISALSVLIILSIYIYVPDLPLEVTRTLLFLHGIFNGGMTVCFAAAREHNRPETAGATLGFVNTMVMASGAIFQPLIGWLLDANWDGVINAGNRVYSPEAYKMAFLSLVACSVVAVVMAALLRESHGRNVLSDTEALE